MKTKIKILHLEDMPADAELVARELKKGNIQCEILVVGNRTDFESALTAFVPDLILSDHTLPSFDSREAINIIHSKGIIVPFILVTATVSDEYAVELMKAGADDYILKDRLNRLPQAIQNAMQKNRTELNLQTIFESTSEGFVLINNEGIVKSFNKNSAQTILQNTDKIIKVGYSIYDFIHPSRKENYNGVLSKVLAGESIHYDHSFERRNGEIKWFSYNLNPSYNKSGVIEAVCITSSDITERKLAEDVLRRSQSMLHTIFEGTSEGIVLVDKDGLVKAFNRNAIQTIFMNTKQELVLGSSIYSYGHPSRKDTYKEIFSRAMAGELVQYDFSVESTTGEIKWFSLTVNPVYDASGDIENFCVSTTEITKRKEAEQRLLESETFAKDVLSSLNAQIAVIDQNGTLITVNKAWSDFGLENGETPLRREQAGSNYFSVCKSAAAYGDKFAAQALRGIQSILEKEALFFEMEYPCHSSEEQRWFILRAMAFESDANRVVISHINITSRKIAENALNDTTVNLQKTLNERNKILDSSLDIICTISFAGEFLNISAACQNVLGYAPEEIIGSYYINFIYKEDVNKTIAAATNFANNIEVPLFENRYVHKNGSLVSLLWSINWDANLKVMFCIAKDVTEKRRLEKGVENERDQFYHMFLKAPSAIGMLKGADHVFEMANPLFLDMIGRTQIIGKTVLEVLPEIEDQGFIDMINNVYRTSNSNTGIEALIQLNKDGTGALTDVYINFVSQTYRNNAGDIEGVFLFINDVTEQVVSRREIEKSEKFFKGVIESSADMITIIDITGKPLFVSPAVYTTFGFAPEDILNRNFMDVVHPDDIAAASAFIAKVIENPSVPMTAPLIRERKKDGTYMWVEGTLTNFLETDGINAIVANFRDITERKMSDEENKFQANLLNTIGQAAVATDLNGVVNYWNKAAEDIYGWTKEEAIGHNIMELIPSETTIEQATQIMETLKKGNTWAGEFKSKKKDGTIFPALVTNTPIYDEHNKFKGIIGVSLDNTEKKHLETLLDKSNRLAKIGSWEIDIVKGTVFWSDITKEIREVDKDYEPFLEEGINHFKSGMNKKVISQKVAECIAHGTSSDEELQIITFKDNLKWVRTIGEGEFINGKCVRIHGSFQDIDKLKNAEIKIRESEFRYRQIVETTKEGIWMIDENNRTTFVNQKMCDLLERTEAELIGKKHVHFMDEDGKALAKAALERRKRGISEEMEFNFISQSGRRVLTKVSANPIFDAEGIFRGSLGVVSDLTEKIHLQTLLEKSNRLARIGSWEMDVVKGTVFWSAITKEIREVPEDFEPEFTTGLNLFPKGINHKIMSHRLKRCIDKGISWDVELQTKTFKGNLIWVRTIGEAVLINGKCSKIYGSLQDITERKQIEQSLQESQSYIKAIIENTDASIYSLDTNLRYIAFNKLLQDNLKKLYGIDLKIGDHISKIFEEFTTEDVKDWEKKYSKALKGNIVRFEKEIIADGVVSYSSFTMNPIWEHHKVIGLSCFVYDITNQKIEQQQKEKMTADLIQRNLDLEQFTFIVSHNLRAPTANIMGFTEILKDDTLTAEEQQESLHGLSVSVSGLDNIIKDINTILQTKLEDHENKETIIFDSLVDKITLSIGNLIDKHHVKINTDFSEVEHIYSLNSYLHSIFYNLISNSIKYSKPDQPPHIEIKSKKQNGKIILTFKDNGLGIDLKGKHGKIFGLYNRFHTHVEGKGMGLFMVKTQVESLGGKITVSSELNKGTEFKIEFKI